MSTESDSEETLITSLDEQVKLVRTRSLDISFNELLDMYQGGELTISPAYQRLFRWDEGRQSRFIESLLLEMPIPPIYTIEIEQNKMELIDGLQRISTWLHFRGEHPHRIDENGNRSALELQDCDIVEGLNGHAYATLPTALRIKLKRQFVRVEIIRKESDNRLRYHMFKRLNTGGEQLSEQEVRNCTIRLLHGGLNDALAELARQPSFAELTETLSDGKKDRMYREELVLRFLALKNAREKYKHIVRDFLTEYLEEASDAVAEGGLDLDGEKDIAVRTFDLLQAALGERAFSTVPKNAQQPTTTFSVYHFEGLVLGVQPIIALGRSLTAEETKTLGEVLLGVKASEDFRKLASGGGQNYAGPLRDRVALVEDAVNALPFLSQ